MSLAKARKLKGVRPRYDEVGSAETSDFPKDGRWDKQQWRDRKSSGRGQDMLQLYIGLRDCQREKIRLVQKVET